MIQSSWSSSMSMRFLFPQHRRYCHSRMTENTKRNYFCSSPDEAIKVQTVTTDGSARTLFTYFETDHYSTGFEWVEVGCEVPFHQHDGSEELIFCTHGEGIAYVDNEHDIMKPGVLVRIPPNTQHKFVNTSKERLGFTWTLNPPRDAKKFMPGLSDGQRK